MQQEDRIWHLLSRYLADEASQDEINELNEITYNDPRVKKVAVLLSQFWQITLAADKAELENEWNKLLQRMD